MSCFGCRKKYGLFTKEVGCPNCGYSYCVKCLKCTAAVPRRGNEVMKVCLICFDKLSKLQSTEKVIDCEALPGTILNKNIKSGPVNLSREAAQAAVAALEEEPPAELGAVLAPITPKLADEGVEINDNLDIQITERLKNLKEKLPMATDAEIRQRLSQLKDLPVKDYSKKDVLFDTDTRSDEQKMKDLMQEFLEEANLNKQLEGKTDAGTDADNGIAEIERRLRALRNLPTEEFTNQNAPNTPSDNEDDDEAQLKNIMKRYLEEAQLPNADLIGASAAPLRNDDTEELPWCNICNEDAVFRCFGCDGELFCKQCYKEVHDDEEYKEHVKINYNGKPHFKEDHF